jgi:hypothetical protein
MKKFLTKKFETSKFIQDIFGWTLFDDGFMEVVVDLNYSKYFDHNQVYEAIKSAENDTSKGHQVYFGPGIRFKDQGNVRSKIENIFGSHSIWVDIDPPDKTLSSKLMKQESEKLLENFLKKLEPYRLEPSYIVSSGNGFHVYFYFQKILWTDSQPWIGMQSAVVELADGDVQAKDATRLLRFPGSLNLKDKENPKQVTIVGGTGHRVSLDKFKQLVQDFPQRKVANTVPVVSKPLGFIPPCFEYSLTPGNKPPKGFRHLVRQVVSTFLFNEGVSQEDAVSNLMHTGDDSKKVEADVRGVYKALGRDPGRYSVGCKEGSSLRALVDAKATICDEENCQFGKPGTKKMEKDDEVKEELSMMFDGLVDLVVDDKGNVVFLVKKDGNLVLEEKHETPDCVLIPPPKVALLWTIPRASEVIKHYSQDTDENLFNDLVEYHRGISELPTDEHYKYFAIWVMHSYLYIKGEYSPINSLFAVPERGKTRTGKGIIYAAWRGVHVTSLDQAHIIRLATNQVATIFFDIMDVWKKVERAGSEDLILGRFEKGHLVPRVLYPEKGKFLDTEYFEVFGPTILASNQPMHHILDTRAIETVMPESDKIFNDDVKPHIGLPFRERLVAFRARWMDKQLPKVDKLLKGRLGDISRPLFQIVDIVCNDHSWFLEFCQEIEISRKESSTDSLDALVVRAIVESSSLVKNGRLKNSDILSAYNAGQPLNCHITAKKLGWVTKRLGFEKDSNGKNRGIVWNSTLVARLQGRYGITLTV